MQIETITALQWADAAHSCIACSAKFAEFAESLPFCAHPDDTEAHGREIYTRAVAGDFGPIAEYVAPPVATPTSLSMKQARLALLSAGLYAQAQSAIAAMTGTEGQKAQIEWEFSSTVVRGDALVVQLAAALSLTDAQLDDLFLAGSKL